MTDPAASTHHAPSSTDPLSGTTTASNVADEARSVLTAVIDPELGADIVSLGMVHSLTVEDDLVDLEIRLTTAGCPLRATIQRDVRARLLALPGITQVRISWGELDADAKAAAMASARRRLAENPPDTTVPPTTTVIMIASGKGGVGKSSLTVNLAAALAAGGREVGVLDADIWGFSVPRMAGIEGRLAASTTAAGRIEPRIKAVGRGHLHIVSMGLLIDQEDSALMWRGLMLQRAVRHFLEDVAWPKMDYLLVDMPPGTGDVQMGLARLLPRADVLVVTTPALAAQKVAARAVSMARKSYLRVAGVIENMSVYVDDDGREHHIFGNGGGDRLARDTGAPLLARIPIDPRVATGGDTGDPAALRGGPAADAIVELADALVGQVCPPRDFSGCSARLLDAVETALRTHDEKEPAGAALQEPSGGPANA